MRPPHTAAGSPTTQIPYSKVEQARSQGYELTLGDEYRYTRDYAHDPHPPSYARGLEYAVEDLPGVQMLSGFGAGAMKTVAGIASLLNDAGPAYDPKAAKQYMIDHPGAGPDEAVKATMRPGDPQGHIHAVKSAANWLNQNAETHGFWQGFGDFGENVAELMSPEALGELAKGTEAVEGAEGASKASKLADAGKVAQVLEKYPRIRALLTLGMRTAARGAVEGGAQTYIKTGGDTQAATRAAEIGGAVGGATPLVIGGGGQALYSTLRRFAHPAITNEAVEDAARSALENRLAETNATRTPPTNALPASTEPYQFRIRTTPPAVTPTDEPLLQTAAKRPQAAFKPPQFTAASAPNPTVRGIEGTTGADVATATPPGTRTDIAGGGGEVVTHDLDTAAAHLQSIQRALDDPTVPRDQKVQLRQMRDDMQQQIVGYYQHLRQTGEFQTPNFAPVNTREVLANTASPREAAEHLRDAARPVYDQANDVSGGQWQTVKDQVKADREKLAGTADIPSNRKARIDLSRRISEGENKLAQILDDPRNGIDRTDAAQAIKNMRAAFVMDDFQDAIAPMYSVEAQTGLKTGEYRGVNGNRLLARFDALLRDNPDARDLIGSQRVDALRDVFHANDTLAARKRFGSAVAQVATMLGGYHLHGALGAVGGETAYLGIRRVLDGMVRDPNIARNLLFAIDAGARPENYSPMVARMIEKTETAAAQYYATHQAEQEKRGQQQQQ